MSEIEKSGPNGTFCRITDEDIEAELARVRKLLPPLPPFEPAEPTPEQIALVQKMEAKLDALFEKIRRDQAAMPEPAPDSETPRGKQST